MLIDTHRHLGGSIPASFIWDTIQKLGLKHLAETYDQVIEAVTFHPNETRTFHKFLDKFKILDEIPWTEDLIDQSIAAICQELQKENIHYTWMDFSINKYMQIGWHKHEAIQFIHDSFYQRLPYQIGLILSLKYESMQASQKQYAKLIEHETAANCLIGIDLVGNEEHFDHTFYEPIFKDWNDHGRMTRAHVGESQHHSNIKNAIEHMKVTNIAHGIQIINDPDTIKLAKDNDITFDLALTSNYMTGVCNDLDNHPAIRMQQEGLRLTIGSDDPTQCGITLADEYKLAERIGLDIKALESTALRNTFNMHLSIIDYNREVIKKLCPY